MTTDDEEKAQAESTTYGSRISRRGRFVLVAVLVIAVLAVVYFVVFSGKQSVFVSAVESCGLENNMDARVGDNGASLTLDMEGEEDSGKLTYSEVFCVLDELNLPDSVYSLMGATRALDGRQTADWDGIHASWSYHPDDGMDVILSTN